MSSYLKVKKTGEVGRVNQIDGDQVHLCLPSDVSEPPRFLWFAKHLLEEIVLPVAESFLPGVKPVADAVLPVVNAVIKTATKRKAKPAVKKVAVKAAAPAPKKAAAPAPKKAATKKAAVKK